MKETQELYDDLEKYHGRAVIDNVRTIAGFSMGGIVIGLGFGFFMAGSWGGVGIIAITALACYAIGSGFGFLFSIPKSAQDSEAGIKVPLENGDRGRTVIPRDNTNLEQISDWLVKILIGASLVQLSTVKHLLETSAASLSKCLLMTKAAANGPSTTTAPEIIAGAASSPVIDTYCTAFCTFLILYFIALGFLTGYLVTRLWLPYVMLRSALAMEAARRKSDEDEARQQGFRKALSTFGLMDPESPPKSEASRSEGGGKDADDDPNKGKFGGKAEAGGLKLTGEVKKMDDIDEDYFQVTLKVVTDGSRQLTQPVTFHLHPTFPQYEVKVAPNNNEAILTRAAWGAFTVGVTIEGEPTQLELDLATLPGAPELFKSR
jgi:hypothetical protein